MSSQQYVEKLFALAPDDPVQIIWPKIPDLFNRNCSSVEASNP